MTPDNIEYSVKIVIVHDGNSIDSTIVIIFAHSRNSTIWRIDSISSSMVDNTNEIAEIESMITDAIDITQMMHIEL